MTNANKLARRLASLATWAALLLACAAHAQTVVYYHTDALGSPVATTDAAGNVIERTEYEPYGQVLNHPIGDGPGYTGHVSDAQTGLSYMQQRYYDPVIGRFLSMDPVTADAAGGGNFNRYWYAGNNPYKFVDPDGRQQKLGPSNFNVDMSQQMPNAISNAWKTAELAATPKAMYATVTVGEAAGGALVGAKAQGLSGTAALSVDGPSISGNGPEAVIATPAGSAQLQASSRGIEANTVNAQVVGAHAGPAGWEAGVSSLATANAIDNLDVKTTVTLPVISVSWGRNKEGAGWAVGMSIAKPSAAFSYVRIDRKPSEP